MEQNATTSPPPTEPKWKPLTRNTRRVLGVLIEKAKTTPDNYPLSLNALRNGCNQKSNRFPSLQMEEEDVEDALEDLRTVGAISVIQGTSRVDKYRHLAYEWLGVDKVEIAVMAELLLRGAQTVGELRGRAARMEPIKGLTELEPVLQSLVKKDLVLYLSPPGRGATVTHNLYQPQELDKVKRDCGVSGTLPEGPPVTDTAKANVSSPTHSETTREEVVNQKITEAPPQPVIAESSGEFDRLREELDEFKSRYQAESEQLQDEVRELKASLDELNRQLGNL